MLETFNKTFFCFLDLLGFSRFVLKLSNEYRDDPGAKQKKLMHYYGVLEPLVNGSIFQKDAQPTLNSFIVSDSIFLWTDDTTLESFRNILQVVKNILYTNFSWKNGFPCRGAIAMGSVTFQKTTMDSPKINRIATVVGDSLVRAAELERYQQWAGCIIDDAIIEHFEIQSPNIDVVTPLRQQKLMVRYPVPMKKNNRESYVVCWPFEFVAGERHAYDRMITKTFERNGVISEKGIRDKLNNTMDFVHDLHDLYIGDRPPISL